MKKVERVLLCTFGMSLMSVGIALIVNSRFGDDLLTLFVEASRNIYPLSIGTYNFIYGSIMVIVSFFCDKKKIGYGTIYYVLVGVILIDVFIEIIPIATNIYMQLLYVLLVIIIMAVSVTLAISTRLGLSYYDAFLYSVAKRLNSTYVKLRYILEAFFLVASLLLKTYPGIGTLIYFVALGPAINWSVNKFKNPIRKHLGMSFED